MGAYYLEKFPVFEVVTQRVIVPEMQFKIWGQ